MIDPYEVLGVNRSFTKDEIKKVYLQQVKKHHPDVGGSEEKMKAINQAWDSLKDSHIPHTPTPTSYQTSSRRANTSTSNPYQQTQYEYTRNWTRTRTRPKTRPKTSYSKEKKAERDRIKRQKEKLKKEQEKARAEAFRIKNRLVPLSPAEARRRNLKYYKSKPCKYGHDSLRDLKSNCLKCREIESARLRCERLAKRNKERNSQEKTTQKKTTQKKTTQKKTNNNKAHQNSPTQESKPQSYVKAPSKKNVFRNSIYQWFFNKFRASE